MEENNHNHDLISVQANFQQFETHIIEVIQQAMLSFNQFVGGQAQKVEQLYSDMLGTAQRVPPDFEWSRFVERNGNMLVDPHAPERTIESIVVPNQNHRSTKPLIEGSLERKSRNKLSLSGYSTGYYAVTPSKYLHEFKDNDNLRKDPVPELSIYLPDATIGAPNGEKFHIKGKDVSKGLGGKLTGSSELSFKAHTAADAQKWFDVVRSVAGAAPLTSEPVSPVSPAENRNTVPPAYAEGSAPAVAAEKPGPPAALQTTGLTGGQTVASPATATPVSAIDHAVDAPGKS